MARFENDRLTIEVSDEDGAIQVQDKVANTCWAQADGLRGETETLEKMQRRVEYDLYYIEHWSLWLDIKIIAMTVVRGWTGANAY